MFLATNSRSQFSQPLYVLGITKWVHSAQAAVISWTVQVLSCSTLLVLQWKRRRKSNLTPKAVFRSAWRLVYLFGYTGGSKTVSRELLQSIKNVSNNTLFVLQISSSWITSILMPNEVFRIGDLLRFEPPPLFIAFCC